MFNIFPTGCNRLEDPIYEHCSKGFKGQPGHQWRSSHGESIGKQMEHEMEAGFIQGFIGNSANTAVPDDLPSSL